MVSFFFALPFPAGADVWLGAGGKVGASDRMIVVAMSHVQWRFVVPIIVCWGKGSCVKVASLARALGRVALVLRVLRCPQNDPSGAIERGGRG